MRAAVWMFALVLTACFKPASHDGNLKCPSASDACPSGYHCASDTTCWQNGKDPSLSPQAPDIGAGGEQRALGAMCGADAECESSRCVADLCCEPTGTACTPANKCHAGTLFLCGA